MKKYLPYIIVGILILVIALIYAKKRNQAADQKAIEEMVTNGSGGFGSQPAATSGKQVVPVDTCDCEKRADIQEGITAYQNMHPDFPYKQDMYYRVKELCPCAQL